MPDYTLFCAPDTYAMSAHAILEETGANYTVRWVRIFAENSDPDFLAASPHCRTPALSGPDGSVFETGAVCLYLAERHPDAGLVIPPGDPHRGAFLQWFHYLATTAVPPRSPAPMAACLKPAQSAFTSLNATPTPGWSSPPAIPTAAPSCSGSTISPPLCSRM